MCRITKRCVDSIFFAAVSGAHVPGSVIEEDIALDKLGCDFFCCTFSKWLFAPRSIAALYVREGSPERWPHIDVSRLDPSVVPPMASSSEGERTYVVDHLMKGVYDEATRDYSHAVVQPFCISLWRKHSVEILQSARENVIRCHNTLRRAWGTESVVAPPFAQGAMACVFLPTDALIKFAPNGLETSKQLKCLKKWVHDELLENYDVEVRNSAESSPLSVCVKVPVFVWRGGLAVRVSVPIYIRQEHIEGLANAVVHLLSTEARARARL